MRNRGKGDTEYSVALASLCIEYSFPMPQSTCVFVLEELDKGILLALAHDMIALVKTAFNMRIFAVGSCGRVFFFILLLDYVVEKFEGAGHIAECPERRRSFWIVHIANQEHYVDGHYADSAHMADQCTMDTTPRVPTSSTIKNKFKRDITPHCPYRRQKYPGHNINFAYITDRHHIADKCTRDITPTIPTPPLDTTLTVSTSSQVHKGHLVEFFSMDTTPT
ncbi:hypothetical protein FQR65_LT04291 [Abscondita terminalis]|nr:hypothetical protein FQR65_LT04291 [Abscondita terminalis]